MVTRRTWIAGTALLLVAAAITVVVIIRGEDDDLPRVVACGTEFRPAGPLLDDGALANRAARAWSQLPATERLGQSGSGRDTLCQVWAGPRDGASEVLVGIEGVVFRYRERRGQAGTITRLPDTANMYEETPIPLSGGGWLMPTFYRQVGRPLHLVRQDSQGTWSDRQNAQADRDGVIEAGDDAYLLGRASSWRLNRDAVTWLQIGFQVDEKAQAWLALDAALTSSDGARLAIGALDGAFRAITEAVRGRHQAYDVSVIGTQPLAPAGPFAAMAVSPMDDSSGDVRVAVASGNGTVTVLPGQTRVRRDTGYEPVLTGGWITTPATGVPLFVAVGDAGITSITVGDQTVVGNVAAFPSVRPGATPKVTGMAGSTPVPQLG